jgi:hypothetical protein
MAKHKFTGTPEEVAAFEKGIEFERERLLKVLKKYHENFGKGSIEESDAMMQIRYMYNFVIEARSA